MGTLATIVNLPARVALPSAVSGTPLRAPPQPAMGVSPRMAVRRKVVMASQQRTFATAPPQQVVRCPKRAPKHVFVNGMLSDEKGAKEAAAVLEEAQQALGVPGPVETIVDPTLGPLGDPFKYLSYRLSAQTPAALSIADRLEQAVAREEPVFFHTHSQGNAAYDVGRNLAVGRIAKAHLDAFKDHPLVVAERGKLLGNPGAVQQKLARAFAERKVNETVHHLASGSSMTPDPRFKADLISPEAPGPNPWETLGLLLSGIDPAVAASWTHVTDPVPAMTTDNRAQGNVAYHALPSHGGFGIQNHSYNDLYAPEDARVTAEVMIQRGWAVRDAPAAPPQPVAKHVFVNGMLSDEAGAREAALVLEKAQHAQGIPGSVEVIADPTLGPGDPLKYMYYRLGGETPASRAITDRIALAVDSGEPVVFHTHSQGNAAYDVGRNRAVERIAEKHLDDFKDHPRVIAERERGFELGAASVQQQLAFQAAEQKVNDFTHHLATGSSMTPDPKFNADLITPLAAGPSPWQAFGLVMAGIDPSGVKGFMHAADPVPALTTSSVSQGRVAFHPVPSQGGFGLQNHSFNDLYAPEDAKVTAMVLKRRGWTGQVVEPRAEGLPRGSAASGLKPIPKHVFVNGMANTEKSAAEAAAVLEKAQQARGIPGSVEVIADPTLGPGDPFKYAYYRLGGETPASQAITDRIELAADSGEPVVFHTHSQGNAAYDVGRNRAVERLTEKHLDEFQDHPQVVAERKRSWDDGAAVVQRELARQSAEQKVSRVTHQIATGSSMTPDPRFNADLISPEAAGPSPLAQLGLLMSGKNPAEAKGWSHVADPVPAGTTDNRAQGNVAYHPVPSDGGFGLQNHSYENLYAPEDARVTADALKRRGW